MILSLYLQFSLKWVKNFLYRSYAPRCQSIRREYILRFINLYTFVIWSSFPLVLPTSKRKTKDGHILNWIFTTYDLWEALYTPEKKSFTDLTCVSNVKLMPFTLHILNKIFLSSFFCLNNTKNEHKKKIYYKYARLLKNFRQQEIFSVHTFSKCD